MRPALALVAELEISWRFLSTGVWLPIAGGAQLLRKADDSRWLSRPRTQAHEAFRGGVSDSCYSAATMSDNTLTTTSEIFGGTEFALRIRCPPKEAAMAGDVV